MTANAGVGVSRCAGAGEGELDALQPEAGARQGVVAPSALHSTAFRKPLVVKLNFVLWRLPNNGFRQKWSDKRWTGSG